MLRIAVPEDFNEMYPIFQSIIEKGDAYDFDETTTREEAFNYWFGPKVKSFIFETSGKIAGFFKIIPNHKGRGNHIANASFMVAQEFRGQGIGRKMGNYCIEIAQRLGYKAIQFNYVIATNTPAVNLWKSLGFQELCHLPKAFNHKTLGFVDAIIFYKTL